MQPSIARALIEYPPNVDKGLCQRFLWLAPEPTLTHFNDFPHVDKEFCASIGMIYFICVATFTVLAYTRISVSLLSTLWVSNKTIRRWTLPCPCDVFQRKHDEIVLQLKSISCMDDFLSGVFFSLLCVCTDAVHTCIHLPSS